MAGHTDRPVLRRLCQTSTAANPTCQMPSFYTDTPSGAMLLEDVLNKRLISGKGARPQAVQDKAEIVAFNRQIAKGLGAVTLLENQLSVFHRELLHRITQ